MINMFVFCIKIFPNGLNKDDKGWVRIVLALCSLPADSSKVKLNWKVTLTGATEQDLCNISAEYDDDFDYRGNMNYRWGNKRLRFEDFLSYEWAMITADITMINRHDNYGKDLTELEWDKFIKQEYVEV